jgi:outer membrane protein
MTNTFNKRSIYSSFILILTLNIFIAGQGSNNRPVPSNDSLSLKVIIQKVISTYPSVKAAEEAINNADARIGLAKTAYNPVFDMAAAYSNLGPVVKLSIPSFPTFELYPSNNYSATLLYQQLIYDFGRTRQNIEFENENKAISKQVVEQVKQRLSLITVNNFYTLLFLQTAIKIKDEQLATLNEHLQYVEKMKATGSATDYEVLTTKVKISMIESQRVDLDAAIATQKATMNSLLGNDQNAQPVVKNELSTEIPMIPSDSILTYAYHNRDEVLLNEKKSTLAELKYELTKLVNKPMVMLQASGGAKNGYLPDLYKFTPNYVIGVGLKVPIFDGLKNKYNLAQAQSAITTLTYESDYTKRNVSNDVYEAEAFMSAARTKVSQYEMQLSQALKAYSLAEISFKSGVVTNLDLLDANTSVSESSLLLLKARIDFAASVYKLKAALGERIY